MDTDRPIEAIRAEHAAWLDARRPEKRSTPPHAPPKGVGERVFASMLGTGYGYGWARSWSQDRVSQIQHFRHWTYIAIRAIAMKVASSPPQAAWVTPERDERTRHRSYQSRLKQYRWTATNKAIEQHENVEHVPFDHPLAELLRHPNPLDTPYDLWYELLMFLELTGNGYLWVVPDRLGRPRELWVIPSHWVRHRFGVNRITDYYEVWPLIGTGMYRFPAEEIIHFRYKNPMHKVDGYSGLTAGSEWIDTGESIDQTRFWQFKNFCAPFGSIELGPDFHDPGDEDIDRLYAKFFGRLQGEMNFGRPIVLPPGAKYTPLMIAPQQMAYTEGADQMRDYILALHGVPKEVAGVQDAGSEIAMYGPLTQFAMQCINPRFCYLGQAATMHLAHRYDERLRLWWNDATPANPQQVNSDLALDAQWGWVTPNEARAIRGRDPYEHGGDDPMLPMTLSPVPLNTGEDLSALADLRPVEERETIRDDANEEEGEEPEKTGKPPEKTYRKNKSAYVSEDERRAELMEFAKSIVAAMKTDAVAPVVNVTQAVPTPEVKLENHHHAGSVTVNTPENRIEYKSGDLTVNVPETRIPEPLAPVVHNHNVVNVPEARPPVITNVVEPAPVVIHEAPARTSEKTVERDGAGNITRIVEREQ